MCECERVSERHNAYKRVLDAALAYIQRGCAVIPVKGRSKKPRPKDWTSLRLTKREITKHFRDGDNIGLLLGDASGGLVDVDLDCPEALKLADTFLPLTSMIHGRTSKSASHRWYRVPPPAEKTRKFTDLDGISLLELRSTGGQTVVPPSIHESGEPIVWETTGEPAYVDPNRLLQCVATLALAALLVRHWPVPGSRHHASLAVAGMLLRSGWSNDEAAHFVEVTAAAAGDEEATHRAACVRSTSTKLSLGIETTGGRTLAAIIGENVVRRARDFLRIAKPTSATVRRFEIGQTDSECLDPGPYCVKDGAICLEQMKEDGPISKPLCNFVAQVDEELVLDDGAETSRAFLISGKLAQGGKLPRARVPASRFGGMLWVTEQWGFGAIVNAGISTRDRLREAIQRLSPTPRSRRIFTHTGWREIDGQWVYLTANGAVGCQEIEVDLGSELSRYSLPPIPDDPREAMSLSLKLLEVAPLSITVPLLAAVYRAPLASACPLDLSLWIEGQTGSLKSTVASLFLSHFGSFTETALPGTWSSTANQLERRAFILKDMPFVVDDYAPSGLDARELELKASRLLRSQGNLSGRGRLRADLTERPAYPPRGIIISTGEQRPPGQSVLARTLLIELDRSRVNLSALSEAQRMAAKLPNAMAGYVLWLAPQIGKLPEILRPTFDEARHRATSGHQHLRMPGAFAHLWIGLDCALSYAADIGAISKVEADDIRSRSSQALMDLVIRQAQSVDGERPTRRFLSVLATLLTQGRVILLERELDPNSYTGRATIVGWQDDEFLYVIPDAVFNSVARFCKEAGEFFPVHSERLLRDLNKEGFSDCAEDRNTAAVTCGEKKRRVVRLRRQRVEAFLGEHLPNSEVIDRTAETVFER